MLLTTVGSEKAGQRLFEQSRYEKLKVCQGDDTENGEQDKINSFKSWVISNEAGKSVFKIT